MPSVQRRYEFRALKSHIHLTKSAFYPSGEENGIPEELRSQQMADGF